MNGPTSHDVRNELEPRFRRFLHGVTAFADAAWHHLKHKWTDALLALGFVAVIVLSAYALLKG